MLQLPKGHLSYSQLVTYLQCPQKYERRYILKQEERLEEQLFLGSGFHKAEETYFLHTAADKRPTVSDAQDIFNDLFTKGWTDDEGYMNHPDLVAWESSRDQVKDTGVELIGLYTDRIGQQIVPVATELPFQKRVQTAAGIVPFVGRIDLIKSDGKVVDWKTRKRRMYRDDANRELQPLFYSLGMGGPVDFEFHTAIRGEKKGDVEVVPVDQKKNPVGLAALLLERVALAISRGDFPLNPTSILCSQKYCSFWSSCVGAYS